MLFAISDIHGCLGPLEKLVNKCFEYDTEESVEFVFVGDYIDRGPDSKGVIEFLMKLSESFPCVFLRGNHEDMLLHDWNGFMWNGGIETMRSYGWHEDDGHAEHSMIPKEHWDWFRATKLWHKDRLRTYVHAGIHRHLGGVENQSERVMLWVRNEFLLDDRTNGGYVVHGHTPQENGLIPMQQPNRINLDTGAVFGGRLTAAVFNDRDVEPECILQVDSFKKGPLYTVRDGGIYLPDDQ